MPNVPLFQKLEIPESNVHLMDDDNCALSWQAGSRTGEGGGEQHSSQGSIPLEGEAREMVPGSYDRLPETVRVNPMSEEKDWVESWLWVSVQTESHGSQAPVVHGRCPSRGFCRRGGEES